MISIVIPVLNGGEMLTRCLEAIARQQVSDDVEVIVVDSGSTDGSPGRARSRGALVHEIPAEEFNHGGTRNLGVAMSGGEIVAFTVQDALPVGTDWLTELVAPLRDGDRVAGSYSRQLPRDGARPYQHFHIADRYRDEPRLQRATSRGTLTMQDMLFSNVSSAIRRTTLEKFPFAEDLVTAEDQEWSRRVLLAGHAIAYTPSSAVLHSHEYRLRDTASRYFDLGAAADRTFTAEKGSIGAEGVGFVRRELSWLWRNGHRAAIPYTIAHEATRYGAFKLGVHNRVLPRLLRPKVSGTPGFWQGNS